MNYPGIIFLTLTLYTLIYRICVCIFMPRSILALADYRFFIKEVIAIALLSGLIYLSAKYVKYFLIRLTFNLIASAIVVFFLLVRTIDIVFSMIWKSHFQIPILFLKNDMNNFWDIVLSLQGIPILLFFITAIFSILLIFRTKSAQSKNIFAKRHIKKLIYAAISIFFLTGASFFTPNGGNSIFPEKEFITQLYYFKNFGKDNLTQEELDLLKKHKLITNASNENPFLKKSLFTAKIDFMNNSKPNIILITVESLSDIFVSNYDDLMPNLRNFRKKSFSFNNCFNSAYPTNNGLFSVLASQKTVSGVKRPYTKSVTQYLNEAGYNSCLVTSRHLYGFESDYSECFSFVTDKKLSGRILPGGITYSDSILFDIAVNYLASNKKNPFFLHIMTESTHHPWKIDSKLPKYRNDENRILTAYFQTDQSLKILFDYLDNSELKDNTIVIITADHATPFAEGNIVSKNIDKIPLIINFPDKFNKTGKSDTLCTYLDVAPTILHLSGINAENSFEGESLFSPNHSEVQISLHLNFGLEVRKNDKVIKSDFLKSDESISDKPLLIGTDISQKSLFLYMKLMSNLDYYGTPMKIRRKM